MTRLTPARVWAAGLLLVAVTSLAGVACENQDSTTPRDCGELDQPRHCDGQSMGTVPEWERWELLPTGQVRLVDRSSGDNQRGAVR